MRLAGGEGLREEEEPGAGGDQAGEPLGCGAHTDPEPVRVGDEPAREGEEREAEPLGAGRTQGGRQRQGLQGAGVTDHHKA